MRRIAAATWVRAPERGAFDLVYRALPREKDFALRTYPMLGIPLAFLWIGATAAPAGEDGWRADVLALLLFTGGIYLPLLLVQVPASASAEASWLLRVAPQPASAVVGGTIKALFVRWILPLYAGLFALGAILGEGRMLARLWLLAVLLTLVLLRVLYPRCVRDLPLSQRPDEVGSGGPWLTFLAPTAVGLTLLSLIAGRALDLPAALAVALALLGLEVLLERFQAAGKAESDSGIHADGRGSRCRGDLAD
jgi:hypothetical protein